MEKINSYRKYYQKLIQRTCWTSAVVDLNNSIYLCPIDSLCRDRAFEESDSLANSTKASPVERPSGFLTNKMPSTPSKTLHGSLPVAKKSNYKRELLSVTTHLNFFFFSYVELTTCLAVQSYGKPRIRIITCAPFDKNACASL